MITVMRLFAILADINMSAHNLGASFLNVRHSLMTAREHFIPVFFNVFGAVNAENIGRFGHDSLLSLYC
jgi:hypothetical protein